MSTPLRIAIVCSVLFATVPATADVKDKAGDKLICKKEAKTGTRFPTKICHTRAEWDAISEQNKRDFKDALDGPRVDTRRPGG